ncbi:GNAT superfamily N-acetyltransferase [Kitasatospora sp. MAA19]|uniref:GNAT family N-acetyltransferase n=1 Tax=Kitasatospora sp. MAA19 TaxID=3035090 RepID=UPI002473498B|nr:GNAT family N-acetyltransferase [Kitasatospora sp. MAA19]MDH6710994.1 GNAT superfamily N-acetyltransferase [Kitasatospora sp. MAA19]
MVRSWDAAVERAQDRLAAGPRLRAVAVGDEQRFALWDLASLVEGGLGERVAPDGLAPEAERRWREQLGESGREWPGGELYRRRYWVLDEGGAVAGTVAVDNWTRGPGQLAVSSLYVIPEARGRGLAAGALEEVYAAAVAEGLPGFRLETHWTWPHSVRYYLRRGLWVVGWKRSLALARMPQLPRYQVREEDGWLHLLVADRARGWVPMLAAGREGRWLRLGETPDYRAADGWVREYARSTLALHLALEGRPLVRGPQWWAEAWRWSDAGEPEGLAYKIEQFEQSARAAGRPVVGPQYPPTAPVAVPGLADSGDG